MLSIALRIVLATAAVSLVLVLFAIAFRSIYRRIEDFQEKRRLSLRIQKLELLTRGQIAALVLFVTRVVRALLTIFVLDFYFSFTLSHFPGTDPLTRPPSFLCPCTHPRNMGRFRRLPSGPDLHSRRRRYRSLRAESDSLRFSRYRNGRHRDPWFSRQLGGDDLQDRSRSRHGPRLDRHLSSPARSGQRVFQRRVAFCGSPNHFGARPRRSKISPPGWCSPTPTRFAWAIG